MRFRLKPIKADDIEAFQLPEREGWGAPVPEWVGPHLREDITNPLTPTVSVRTTDGMMPLKPGDWIVGRNGKVEGVLNAKAFEQLYMPVDVAQEEFAQRAYDEYVADLELDVAGTEAQDIARILMRPFLDWMVGCSERKLDTKIFLVAYAHFIGWTVYMVNRSTRTDEEFINGLDNLIGLISNEAYVVTSAEERDANFVVHDLLSGDVTNSEGQPIEDPDILPGHERTEVPIDPKTGKTRLDG